MMMASRLDSTHALTTPSRSRMTVLSNLTDAIRGQPSSHRIKRGELRAVHYLDEWKRKTDLGVESWWWSMPLLFIRICLQVSRCAVHPHMLDGVLNCFPSVLPATITPTYLEPEDIHVSSQRKIEQGDPHSSFSSPVKRRQSIECWHTVCIHRRRKSEEFEA